MNQSTIRDLDRLLGSMGCALATLHRRVLEPSARQLDAPSERILFVKFIEQGATVLAFDAIQRAVDRVGAANVYFVVFAENRPILDVLDVVPPENVFVVRSDSFAHFVLDAAKALRAIREARVDTTVDMEFMARAPALFAYLTGARRRVGLHRFTEEAPYRGDLFTHRVPYNPFLHCAQAYRVLVDALDTDPRVFPVLDVPVASLAPTVPRFVPRDDEVAGIEATLREELGARARGPRILLNPNAGDMLPLRKWPGERFVELGRRLLAALPDAVFVVTGSSAERDAADELRRTLASPRVLSLAGRTTLRDMIVLCTRADVIVTNDSGPGHFATLTDIDNVVLFGPGSPEQFGPLGTTSHVLYAGLACSPCVNVYNHRQSACVDNRCMQRISVDAVFAKVLSCVEARVSAGRVVALQ